jgi:hypothetical protein
MSVRERYQQYFENGGSVPWQLETIRRGRAVSKVMLLINITY